MSSIHNVVGSSPTLLLIFFVNGATYLALFVKDTFHRYFIN
jgi:hypothetical protein